MDHQSQRSQRTNAYRPFVEELEPRDLPSVVTPGQVRHAYGFDQARFSVNGRSIVGDGTGQTIAIVDAFAAPRIASDLDVFDQSFAVNAGGWQSIYDAYGPSSRFLTVAQPQGRPAADPTGIWSLETALDVEWAHALAPGAKVLLVQSANDDFFSLLNAVDFARKQPGVSVVSLSWGLDEFAGESAYDWAFHTPANHGGVTFVAATGDNGAPGEWPAVSPSVIAVGGTTLTVDGFGNYQGETGWSGSGGGLSSQEARPAYQSRIGLGQRYRGIPDVAANADYSTAGYVYSTAPVYGQVGGWWQWGGTSAAAPQWAALVAIANQGRALAGQAPLDGETQVLPALYQLPSTDFHAITSGYNGHPAGPGYDLVTGLGSPIANRVIPDLANYRAPSRATSPAASPLKGPSGTTAHGNGVFRAVAGPLAPSAVSSATLLPSFVVVSAPVMPTVAVPTAVLEVVIEPAGPLPSAAIAVPLAERPIEGQGPAGMDGPIPEETVDEPAVDPREEGPNPIRGLLMAASVLVLGTRPTTSGQGSRGWWTRLRR